MATRGRPPGQGKVPGSGRKRGSLDKGERLVISEKLAFDILKTYKRLGPDWLFKVAQERPDLFLNQCLSKLLPPAFKDGADVEFYQQVNVGQLSEMESARRVAFALAKATYQLQDETGELVDISPQKVLSNWQPTPDMLPPSTSIYPEDNPAQAEWAASLPLSPQERADQKLIRETYEATIENYHGSSVEQGLGPVHSPRPDIKDPRAVQRDRILARRRDQLL